MWPTPAPTLPRWADPIVIVSETLPQRGASGSHRGAGFAPNIPAGTWPATALPVSFVLALPRSRDVGAEGGAELEVALRTWTHVSCTSWRARYDGERTALAADDGSNVVLFHDDAWPADLVRGAVAQTVIHADADGRYHDADIHVNGKDFRFSLDAAPGTLDLRSVLVHELGHALGLGHSDDARATMFATGSGLRWRSLEKDDRDGVCSLYPGTGAAGCDVTSCAAPFLCVANTCQRPDEKRDVCSPCLRVADACEGAGDDARCLERGVCGRACTTNEDCGANFTCLATTAAGDLQCVSDTACPNAPAAPQEDAGRADAGMAEGGRADSGRGATLDHDGGGCSCHAITRDGDGYRDLPGSLLASLGAMLGILGRRRHARTRSALNRL